MQEQYLTDYNLLIAQDLWQAHKTKCKYGIGNEKCETCRIKYKDCECCLKYTSVKEDLMEYKCLCNTTFSNHDINKFILLLQKVVYSYEYIDD